MEVGCLLMKQQAQKRDLNARKTRRIVFLQSGSLRYVKRTSAFLRGLSLPCGMNLLFYSTGATLRETETGFSVFSLKLAHRPCGGPGL
jgi:hypothetical protein